jgi:hypothetical protein
VTELGAGLLAEGLEEARRVVRAERAGVPGGRSRRNIERPLQDRLAWSLHTQLPDLVMSREWRRTDLAVLDGDASKPLLLLEVKAMHTADLAGERPPSDANNR